MAGLAYILCSATAFLCAWLLFRAYRRNGLRLLFWSGLCFSFLTLSNLILVLDRLVYPDIDLSTGGERDGVMVAGPVLRASGAGRATDCSCSSRPRSPRRG